MKTAPKIILCAVIALALFAGVFAVVRHHSGNKTPEEAKMTEAAAEEAKATETAAEESSETPRTNGNRESERMLEVNNVRLSVKEAGSGRDMILIHGRTLSKESMDPLFDRYKSSYHVVSYDVRGHGKTESSGEFSLDDLADDLNALMAAYGMEKPVVIGFSMGSYIALRAAEKYPGSFSKVVLIGTRGARTFSSWTTNDEVGRALESFDNMTDAYKVTEPVLVLTGERDVINPPAEGEKVANALPNAVYKIVPRAEHEAYSSNPTFVFNELDNFLNDN